MSAERLSRLQKWILMMLWSYAEDGNLKVKELKACAMRGVKKEMRRFNGSPFKDGHRPQKNAVDVSFSRSLRTLECRNLIFGFASNPMKEVRRINVFDDELLNVKNSKLNNKTGGEL